MEVEAVELQEWEVLHNSDDSGTVKSSNSVEIIKGFEGSEGESEGIIRSDYFSLDSQNTHQPLSEGYATEEGSIASDNPSWIDPGSETQFPMKESGEFWSDSSSDQSDERKFGEFDAKNQIGDGENDKIQATFDGVGEIVDESVNSGKFWSDSCGIEPIPATLGDFVENTEIGVGDNANSRNENENIVIEAKSGGGEEKRSVVWWKLPLEFLNYCVFRVSPVWTFSVAAAVMGFAIWGRRLYTMKRKSRSLQMKVTVDDKKVSQVMSRAARLNEAFSIVKRVPIIRPSLPAAGVTPWPIMSLR